MSAEREATYIERERAIVVREGTFRWRWTVSRQWFGQHWELQAQGVALSRGGAQRLVMRRMRSLWCADRLDRLEIERARQHTSRVPEGEPAPATELIS